MLQENEIIMMLLGMGVFIFVLADHARLKSIPFSRILIASFLVLFMGWILTILEGFFLGPVLNLFEHLCYLGSSALLLMWCWKTFITKETSGNV